MPLVLVLCSVALMAVLAFRKGYDPVAWALAFACVGVFAIALLPNLAAGEVTAPALPAARRRGNLVGWALTALQAVALALGALWSLGRGLN